ncbi:MAG: hypothetical protein JXK07_03450 [Spirochaetes bacterium]|nr:hypothetical protein [Spirochaetota bacterium]MBN2769308.1 hypothetical protein [Spirochaetota bacterium]
MDKKERVALIRKGNELYNNGDYTAAEKIFIKTGYKDGIIRIGDYLYYDQKMPLAAYKYYKLAGCNSKISEIYERMVFAMKCLMEDKSSEDLRPKIHLEPVDVHPMLKIAAEEILRNNGELQE